MPKNRERRSGEEGLLQAGRSRGNELIHSCSWSHVIWACHTLIITHVECDFVFTVQVHRSKKLTLGVESETEIQNRFQIFICDIHDIYSMHGVPDYLVVRFGKINLEL